MKFNLLKSRKTYKSIYLKEYIIKIDGKENYEKLKFCFKELLKIGDKKHKYKEISNMFYELLDNNTYIVILDESEEYFFGYEKNNNTKTNGVLITI